VPLSSSILILCTNLKGCVYHNTLTVCSFEKHDSAVQVSAVAALNLAQQAAEDDLQLRDRGSRLLLTLAKWLQQENHLVSVEADNDRSAVGRLLAWEKAHYSVHDPSIFGNIDVQSKECLL